RRRHTRWPRDWSSDVCSSDLSQAMDTLFWLTDRYGPRLTGSPDANEAADWTMKKMTEWGLANVHREDWDFGRSWSLVRFSAHMKIGRASCRERVEIVVGRRAC